MIVDHELLKVFADQRREELRRSLERSRSFPAREVRALRHPIRTVMAPLRPVRRQT
ncbi:MAG TPA: hypothetical protein VOB72_09745 [Candidatus Dormibacteraeota bacterium]|nr:hypothetical protein [Candidatus Dormibacteraeota bacterium]